MLRRKYYLLFDTYNRSNIKNDIYLKAYLSIDTLSFYRNAILLCKLSPWKFFHRICQSSLYIVSDLVTREGTDIKIVIFFNFMYEGSE